MMAKYQSLIRRELWEHRGIIGTPIAVGVLMIVAALTGQVSASALGANLDLAMMGANELDPAAHKAIVTFLTTGISTIFIIAMWVLIVFYALDALYAERKDKSILFWRSLPITDAESVLSKLAVALLVIPLITLAGIFVTQIVSLLITTVWVNVEGGNAGLLIWRELDLIDIWAFVAVFTFAVPLWLSPFVGWYLFVSAWTKRAPLAVAFMPILILPGIERIFLGSSHLASLFFERSFSLPIFSFFRDGDGLDIFGLDELSPADVGSLLDLISLGRFFGSASFWGGLLVCAAFTVGAIYVRRYRGDS